MIYNDLVALAELKIHRARIVVDIKKTIIEKVILIHLITASIQYHSI